MILSPTETLIKIGDERQLKAMTGVTQSQLEILVQEFTKVLADTRQARYEQAVLAGKRPRKPGGGRHGKLTTTTSKVLLVLVYCKLYPTYDDLGSRFGISKSAAFGNLNAYFPLVAETLARLGVLPHRTFENLTEFREFLASVEDVIIDVTERRRARPKDPTLQTDS
jgi:Helix-turn-helix of DDE superfamily endonuclease